MKGFPSLPTSERNAAWTLSRWKLSLSMVQHRERMQLRLLQGLSDQTVAWRRRSFFPAVLFLTQLPANPESRTNSAPPPMIALPRYESPRVTSSVSDQKSVEVFSSSSSNRTLEASSYWKLPYSRIRVPRDPVKGSQGRWVGKMQTTDGLLADRGERFLGPLIGPRPLTNPARLNRVLESEDFDRWEALRLLGPKKAALKARYGVRGKTQQTLAKARLGQATLRARLSRRFSPNRLLSDRPYRSVRARDLVLGRRVRPFRAARLRPTRRTDLLADRIRRERTRLQGVRKSRLIKGQQSLVSLPNAQSWSRFVLPQNPLLAQERRQWWRDWHQSERRNFYETRRAGSLQRDRAGRRNLGWWRFLSSSHIDLPQQISGSRFPGRAIRRPISATSVFGFHSNASNAMQRWIAQSPRGEDHLDWAYPSRFQPFRDQRSISLGWATRLKQPKNLEKVVAESPKGSADYASSYWRISAPFFASSMWLVPCSFATIWCARLILGQSFLSVQMDFVRALDQLVRRGGRREMDPEWMEWLLEALGVSQQNAGIRHYLPGTRSLARTLAGLRRESSTLLEVVWYLRTQQRMRALGWLPKKGLRIGKQRGPRPTLLVGAPGTGKTRLVRVLADEAAVPVIYQCLAAFTDAGSNFTSFGFGRTVAPRAVQRGFAEARERVPAILFLDELDALGANRGGVLLDSQSQLPRSGDQVLGLGQLLVELDSRAKNEGLVVFGATNRPAELDPALLRPGRFDRHLSIPLPNRKKRRAILQLYARQRGLNTADWNWNSILAQTAGASAAHLARITNWTAISRILTPPETTTSNLLEQSLRRLLRSQTPLPENANQRDPFSKTRPAYAKARQIVVQVVLNTWSSETTVARTKPQSLPVSLFSPMRYSTQKEKRAWLCSLFAPRIGEWLLLQRVAGKTRTYWQQRNLQTNTWRITSWVQDTHLFPQNTQTFRSRSFLEKEFQHDRSLLNYSLTLTKNTGSNIAPVTTAFSHVLDEIKQQEEWPREWYSFEIPEVRGFRSVHWLPPELHVKSSIMYPKKGDHRLFRRELYNQTASVLERHRSELDLLVLMLLQRDELESSEVLALFRRE